MVMVIGVYCGNPRKIRLNFVIAKFRHPISDPAWKMHESTKHCILNLFSEVS